MCRRAPARQAAGSVIGGGGASGESTLQVSPPVEGRGAPNPEGNFLANTSHAPHFFTGKIGWFTKPLT